MELLIIDNDQTCREAICFLVESEGHLAEGAMWTNDVWNRIQAKRFDAVLLDLDLGAANGLDVLGEFRESKFSLPVVLVASELTPKIAQEAMRRGALDLLEKPFRREHLIAVLARLQRFQQLNRHIERLERKSRASLPVAVKPQLRPTD